MITRSVFSSISYPLLFPSLSKPPFKNLVHFENHYPKISLKRILPKYCKAILHRCSENITIYVSLPSQILLLNPHFFVLSSLSFYYYFFFYDHPPSFFPISTKTLSKLCFNVVIRSELFISIIIYFSLFLALFFFYLLKYSMYSKLFNVYYE